MKTESRVCDVCAVYGWIREDWADVRHKFISDGTGAVNLWRPQLHEPVII